MTKKFRLIILLVCVFCFAVVAPLLVLYSLGDKIDFAKMKIVATGGIYVRTFPSADQIVIDSKTSEKPGIFANSIFVQNLMPGFHHVFIAKDGYYGYNKDLLVKEKEVTKLENVSLFKSSPTFSQIIDTPGKTTLSPFAVINQPDKFIIKNNNLYYSATTQNAGLTATQKATPILKSVVAWTLSGSNIDWVSSTGVIYQANLNNIISGTILAKDYTKLSTDTLKIVKTGNYKIINYNQNIFANNNGELLSLNTKTSKLNAFASSVKDAKFSPDGLNMVYNTNNEIYISLLSDPTNAKILLYKSTENISNLSWINNNYIIFTSGDKIVLSEIDYRGNVNIINLPTPIALKSPQLIFNQQEGKLYILTQKTVLVSEKLTQ